MMYNPANWYWVVGGTASQVWSSARLQFVSSTDATYQAWLAAGNMATAIDSVADLGMVMQIQVVPLLQSTGVQLQSTGTPAMNGVYAVDPVSIGQAAAIAADLANNDGLPGGGTTFTYTDALGLHGPLTQVNFLNAYKALKNFIYECGQTLATNLAGGQAALPSQPVAIP
jgi:hypothetical protein